MAEQGQTHMVLMKPKKKIPVRMMFFLLLVIMCSKAALAVGEREAIFTWSLFLAISILCVVIGASVGEKPARSIVFAVFGGLVGVVLIPWTIGMAFPEYLFPYEWSWMLIVSVSLVVIGAVTYVTILCFKHWHLKYQYALLALVVVLMAGTFINSREGFFGESSDSAVFSSIFLIVLPGVVSLWVIIHGVRSYMARSAVPLLHFVWFSLFLILVTPLLLRMGSQIDDSIANQFALDQVAHKEFSTAVLRNVSASSEPESCAILLQWQQSLISRIFFIKDHFDLRKRVSHDGCLIAVAILRRDANICTMVGGYVGKNKERCIALVGDSVQGDAYIKERLITEYA